jgi:disulfide bond formation protein DsbB
MLLSKSMNMNLTFKQTIYLIIAISLISGLTSIALSLIGYQACIYCWTLRIISFVVVIAGIAILILNKKKFTPVLTILNLVGLIVSLWLSYITYYAPKFCTSDCSNQPFFFGIALPIYVAGVFAVLFLLSAYAMKFN